MLKLSLRVVPYIGTWIETTVWVIGLTIMSRRTLYRYVDWNLYCTSIAIKWIIVVPYIGTWIETRSKRLLLSIAVVVPYIGTWIETDGNLKDGLTVCRTLYRYVDWNNGRAVERAVILGRTLYRYVDWNSWQPVRVSFGVCRTLYRYVHWPEVDTRVIAVAPVKDATVMLLL